MRNAPEPADAPAPAPEPAPAPAAASEQARRRRFFPRFTLRTLTLCVLLFASAFGLWWKWAPWAVVMRLGGHDTFITYAAFAPDGSKILTHCQVAYAHTGPQEPSKPPAFEKQILVWDAATGKQLAKIPPDGKPKEDERAISYATFSRDGKRIVVYYEGSSAAGMQVDLFDAQSGEALLPGNTGMPCRTLAFLPDGKKVLAWYRWNEVELWDLERGEMQCRLEGSRGLDGAWCFSGDGKRVAISGTIDAQDAIGIFELESGRRLQRIPFPTTDWLAFTPDETGLLCRFRLQSLKGNEQTCQALVDELIEKFGKNFHQTDQTLVALVDLKTGMLRRWMTVSSNQLSYISNGRLSEQTFAPAGAEVLIRDGNTLERIYSVKGVTEVWQKKCISRDGTRLLTMTPYELSSEQVGYRPKSAEDPVEVWEWDARTGAEIAHVTLPEKGNHTVRSIGYLDKDERVFASTLNGIYCWDARTGTNLVSFKGAAFQSRDERRVVLWSAGENLRFGDLRSGEILEELEGSAYPEIPSVNFSPDGERMLVLSSGKRDEVQVWERRRDEGMSGVLTLPEFWLTVVFALLTLWSLARDFKTLRKAKAAA